MGFFSDAADAISGAASSAASSASSAASNAADSVTSGGSSSFSSFAGNAADKVSSVGEDAADYATGGGGGGGGGDDDDDSGSDDADTGPTILKQISSTGEEITSSAGETVSDATDEVDDYGWAGTVDEATETGSDLVDSAAESGSNAVDSVSDLGNPLSGDSGSTGGGSNNASGGSSGWADTVEAAKRFKDEASGIGSEDGALVRSANAAGETVLDAATGGDAEGFRQDVRAQEGDWKEVRDRAKEGFESRGLRDNVSATNEVVKFGVDNLVDSPRGPNVQDAGTTVGKKLTGSEDKEELARKVEEGYEGYDEAVGSLDEKAGIEGSNTAKVVGTGYEWFVEDPATATVTAATGIEPESGDKEARAEPVDLVDVATVGGGKAIKGASKAVGKADEAAKVASKGTDAVKGFSSPLSGADDVASGVDDTVEEAASSDAGTAAATGALGAAAAVGGPKAAKSMSKFSAIDDALGAVDDVGGGVDDVAGGVDDVAGGVDDVTGGVGTGSLDSIDNFDGLSSSIGRGDEFADMGEDLTGTSGLFDDVAGGTDDVGDSLTSVGSLTDDLSSGFSGGGLADDIGSTLDEFGGATDDIGSGLASGADDVGSGLASTFDDTFSGIDDTLSGADNALSGSDDAASGADDFFGAGDDIGAATDDAGGAFDDIAAGTDDGGSAVDDAASGADDGGSALDDAGAAADDAPSTITGRIGRWWSNRGTLFKLGAGAIGAAAALDVFGIDIIPDSGDKRDPGAGSGKERYRAKPVKTYDQTGAKLFQVQQGSDETEWQQAGFAILLGKDKEGKLVSAGSVVVINASGRPTEMSPVNGSGENAVPQPRMSSEGQADDAHAAFVQWLKDQQGQSGQGGQGSQGGQNPGPGEGKGPGDSPGLDGSLDVPSKVTQGEPFEAQYSVSLTGEVKQMSARLILAFESEEGLVPVAESDFALGGNTKESSGTFEAPSGWGSIAPGDYKVHAVIQRGGETLGGVASAKTTVKQADEGNKDKGGGGSGDGSSGDGSTWGDPEMVRELPRGWYLYAQVKNGSQETRFMVVGVRDDEMYIYLHSDGRAREEPFYFPTAEEAAAAFKKWLKRDPSEKESPSEGASRPDPSEVKKDAAANDESGAMGVVSRAVEAAKENPVLFAGGTAATLVAVYYLYQNGYLDEYIRSAKQVTQ